MTSETPSNKEGILAQNPILVFIWAVLPVILIFSATFNTGAENLDLGSQYSILQLSLMQVLSVFIMLVIPALVIAYFYKKKVFSFLNLDKRPSIPVVVLSIALIISANLFLNYLVDLNEMLPLSAALQAKFQALQDATTSAQNQFLAFQGIFEFAIVFFTMAIFPALSEEMYFRGLIEGVLIDLKLKAPHVIFISSLLFAMMHFQFYYMLPLLFMGALLGYIYYRTRNLWYSIIVHLVNNGLIVLITASNKANISQIDLEANPSLWTSILGICTFGLLLYFFHLKTEKTKE
ncbi:MAG: CPBP family intramembrane metalloprotease [Chitinophagales bacterium]|nr:CPBP family intramembrane metalloprotease [Chitinophagales bacterium]